MTPLALALLLLDAREAEVRWALPPALLVAVAWHESRLKAGLVRHERIGGCSVSVSQIYLPDCDRTRMQRLLVASVALQEGARLLARARRTCRAHPRWRGCHGGLEWVGWYNGRSRGYADRVLALWRRLLPRRLRHSRAFTAHSPHIPRAFRGEM